MKKNMLISMVLVCCSTIFLLIFFSVGLYVVDTFARNAEASTDYLFLYTKEHQEKSPLRLKEKELALVFPRLVEEPEVIMIAFGGDVMMEGSIAKAMNYYGVDYPFLQVKDEIQEADYAIINLETAVTKRGIPYDKQFNFRTGPQSLKALKRAGFNMVSLANNHTMDYGEEGLIDTIDFVKEAGLDYVGAGRNSEEAYAAHKMEIKGKQIAIIGFSRVLPSTNWYVTSSKPGIASGYQLERMVTIIEDVKKEVDYLFVFMHWGIERKQIPEPYQFNDAKAMIDAGADGIIGAHPHVLQGLDYYNGKPIAYSLGNFLFPDYVTGLTAESCVLTLLIDGDEIFMRYTPYYITGNQVATLSGEAKEQRLKEMEKLSFNVKREGKYFRSSE